MTLKKKAMVMALCTALSAMMIGCSGDDGDNGAPGADGQDGAPGADGQDGAPGADGQDGAPGSAGQDGTDGLNALISQSFVMAGHDTCFAGGIQVDSGPDTDADGMLDSNEVTDTSYICNATQLNDAKNFNRIASFPVCSQIDATCNDDTETASEIVAASTDGMTLIYSDSPLEAVGFVDITDPSNPAGIGTLALAGEPTSVAVKDGYVLVGVNTSEDFINVSGHLNVIDIATQTSMATIDLGGQPDSVAVSPDGAYAAVVIENERDEDLGDGAPPQAPAGALVVVNLSGEPAAWTTTTVSLTGTADLYAEDPEPEYVDINADNVAVVTLQENNHIVLVDLHTATVTDDFSAGAVDLNQIDTTEEDPALISQTESEAAVLREPDGVAWINTEYFATADEGDLDGGSRGFTIFNTSGDVVWNSGASLDHYAVRFGQYPDGRSGNKGNEPENAEVGIFGNERYLFVNSERSSLVFVYDVADPTRPMFKQVLPAAAGPEGALAIPSRNLLVVASEEDNRDDKLRSAVNIYSYGYGPATYPTIASADRTDGTPIPWSAMSGLSADPTDPNMVYAVEDSFYQQNRIFGIDVSTEPATLVSEIRIMDSNDIFANVTTVALADSSVDDDDASRIDVFDEADLAAMINADKSVNIDPEGVAKASDGGFWVASEGSGTVGDADRPVNSLNFIFKTDADGVIEDVITLPDEVNANQLRFGFEGIAEYDGKAYVAFQRVWAGDDNVRIGIYDVASETWSFLFYPLDAAESQNGGWVGLSDLTSLGDGKFLVLERDNQGGPDAAIKRLYTIDVTGLAENAVVSKTPVRDLMSDLAAAGGLTPEKIEGSAVLANGDVLIINDNDGVDDNSGETQLINLGAIID